GDQPRRRPPAGAGRASGVALPAGRVWNLLRTLPAGQPRGDRAARAAARTRRRVSSRPDDGGLVARALRGVRKPLGRPLLGIDRLARVVPSVLAGQARKAGEAWVAAPALLPPRSCARRSSVSGPGISKWTSL